MTGAQHEVYETLTILAKALLSQTIIKDPELPQVIHSYEKTKSF